MSTTYLLLVHEFPQQVLRLVRALQHNGASVLIHIDAKVDRRPFGHLLGELENCTLLSEKQCVSVNWGGYSQTQAILNLCKAALEQQSEARRFTLLSGACYPIARPKQLEQLESSPFLHIDAKLTSPSLPRYNRVKRYHLSDHPLSNSRGVKNQTARERSYTRYIKDFIQSLPPRPAFPLPLYYGPTWWSLPRGALTFVLDFCNNNPDLLTFFRYSAHADEHLYQTVLGNSRWAQLIKGCPHFYCWDEQPNRHCHTLTDEDWERIPNNVLFIRKVNPELSSDLLERIDRLRDLGT